MTKAYIGIDPGLSGSIAVIWPFTAVPHFHDIDSSIPDAIEFLRGVKESAGTEIQLSVVIEGGIPMHSQSSVAAAKYWECRGQLKGACQALGIPLTEEPRPVDWKRRVGIVLHPPARLPKDATEEQKKKHKQAKERYKREMKNKSRDRARDLYPGAAPWLRRVMDDGRADALLLAHYARLVDKE